MVKRGRWIEAVRDCAGLPGPARIRTGSWPDIVITPDDNSLLCLNAFAAWSSLSHF